MQEQMNGASYYGNAAQILRARMAAFPTSRACRILDVALLRLQIMQAQSDEKNHLVGARILYEVLPYKYMERTHRKKRVTHVEADHEEL
jgi:hypothetical protein